MTTDAPTSAQPDLILMSIGNTHVALATWCDGVRSEAEHAGGHVEGSVNIPLTHLEQRIAELPAGRPLAVHCEGGYRSAIAASLLQKLGRRDVHDLVGGYKAWLAAKLPTATQRAAAAE